MRRTRGCSIYDPREDKKDRRGRRGNDYYDYYKNKFLEDDNERYVLIHSKALCFELYLYAEMSGAPIDRCTGFVV